MYMNYVQHYVIYFLIKLNCLELIFNGYTYYLNMYQTYLALSIYMMSLNSTKIDFVLISLLIILRQN